MTSGPFAKYADVLAAQTEKPDNIPLGLQVLTIFGAEGTGKSTLASGFPNHWYYDLEASAVNLERRPLNIGKTWSAFSEWVNDVHSAAKSPFDGSTLIIDPVGDLWDLCVAHGLAQRKMKDMPDDYGRTLNAIRKEFKATLHKLLDLRMSQRMGTVFVAHEEKEDIKTALKTLTEFRPKANDKDIKGWFAAKPQIVIRCSKEDVNPITGQAWPDGIAPKFLTRTNPLTGQDVVKDRTNRLPAFVGTRYEALASAYEGKSA